MQQYALTFEPLARSSDPSTSHAAAKRRIQIPISTLREMLRLDAESGRLFWMERPRHHFSSEKSWRIFNSQFAGKGCGSPEGNGYLQCRITVDGKCQLVKAHRIVWALHYGSWPADQLDHINMDRKDNRPVNLREATNEQNQRNRACRAGSLTGVKGVKFDRARGKFMARITVSGKEMHLGRFDTLNEASLAYAEAAKSLHGEFARPTGKTVLSTTGRAEREWAVVG